MKNLFKMQKKTWVRDSLLSHLSLTMLALIFSIGLANAQTAFVFTNGGGDGLWNNAANWDQGSVPTLADNVEIGGNLTATISAGSNQSIRFLRLKGSSGGVGGNLVIDSGASLTVDGNQSKAIESESGSILINGTLTLERVAVNGNWGTGISFGGSFVTTITNNGTLSIDNVTNQAMLLSNSGSGANSLVNNGTVNIGPSIGSHAIGGFDDSTVDNNANGSINILGAGGDGFGGSLLVNNNVGATVCMENVTGSNIGASVTFTDNGTFNTSGCTPPSIPTMGEWALILLGLTVLSIGVVSVMRWQTISNRKLAA